MTDPRVSRAAYEAGQTYGQRANVLLNGIYDACPGRDLQRRRADADAYADLFDRAIALFDIERLPDRRYRWDRLEELGDEPLDQLDDEFYALEDAGDVIWATLLDYVEAHPETFFTDG